MYFLFDLIFFVGCKLTFYFNSFLTFFNNLININTVGDRIDAELPGLRRETAVKIYFNLFI